jgi:ribosomal protein S8E
VSLKYLKILAVMANRSNSPMRRMNILVGSSCIKVGQIGLLTVEII